MEEHMENSEQNQQEKTFTQEEVNRIVQERLAREKKKTADQETTESNEGKDEHETSVDLRENRVECREFIAEKGYKKELLDISDTSNADTFKSQAQRLAELFADQKEAKSYPGTKPNSWTARGTKNKSSFADTKHIPKPYLEGRL